tara:strand:+ start:210 stop:1013 length:804 start_codon:yes stop_codon:yes gene_type:complete
MNPDNRFLDNLKATGGKNVANILTQAGALTLASHLDKPIGRGLQMAGDLAGLFFGLGSPGPTGPNLAEGQTAVGIPGALADATFNALTGEVVPTKREGGYVGNKGEAVKTWDAPEGSSKPYLSALKRVAENPDSFMGGIAQSMYDNPETVANIVRYGTPAVGLGAAALGLHAMSKPRSDYALAVQGNPHLGSTGNANIDAAAASAYYQQQTAQMKFNHQMQLQAMRQNAQTPANQPYGGSGGIPAGSPGLDVLDHMGRAIYGTGLRL